MKRIYWVFGLALLSLIVAACGGGLSSAPAEEVITIEMTDFAFSPDTIELKVGQTVTINLVNEGVLVHELMIGRELVMDHNVPSTFEHDFFAGISPEVAVSGDSESAHNDDHAQESDHEVAQESGHSHDEESHSQKESAHVEESKGHSHDGFMVELPGNSDEIATITFTVTEDMLGEWELGCFIDNGAHYTAGMTGKLVVTQ